MNPVAIRTHNLSRWAATDQCLRPSSTVTGYCTGTVTGYSSGRVTGYCTDTVTGYCTDTVTGYSSGRVTGYCTDTVTGYSSGRVTGYCTDTVTVPTQLLVTLAAELLVTVPAQLLVTVPVHLLVTVTLGYWLLYRNITKPVKALQEFLMECRQSNSLCIIISQFAGYHLQTISEINTIRWLYSFVCLIIRTDSPVIINPNYLTPALGYRRYLSHSLLTAVTTSARTVPKLYQALRGTHFEPHWNRIVHSTDNNLPFLHGRQPLWNGRFVRRTTHRTSSQRYAGI